MTTQGTQRKLPSARSVLGQLDKLAIELLTQIWEYIYDKGHIPRDHSLIHLDPDPREEGRGQSTATMP